MRDDLRTLLRLLESTSLVHNESGEKVSIADLLRAADTVTFSHFAYLVSIDDLGPTTTVDHQPDL